MTRCTERLKPGPLFMTLCAGLAVCTMALSGGCYKRVVGAKGFGADKVELSEPYQPKGGWLDRQLFGDPEAGSHAHKSR